jgi:glycosyltransferase involved in cell wall biosynthesis
MLSVILPVHNGGSYLHRCVQSLANQDCQPGAFELVILENASTDGSLDALRLLPPTVPRRVVPSDRLLSIEENWGRIAALSDVRDFITTIGHDDALDPQFVRIVTSTLSSDPSIRFLLTHFRLIDEQDRVIRPCRPMAPWETPAQFLAGRLAGIRDSFGTGYAMRFSDYREAGGIPPYAKLIYADDTLWMKLAQRTPLRILADELFSYRLHSSNTSVIADSAVFLRALSSHLDFVEAQQRIDSEVDRVVRNYGPNFIRDLAAFWMFSDVERANRTGKLVNHASIDGWREIRRRVETLSRRPEPSVGGNENELAFALWANQDGVRRRLWRERPTRVAMRRFFKHLAPQKFVEHRGERGRQR